LTDPTPVQAAAGATGDRGDGVASRRQALALWLAADAACAGGRRRGVPYPPSDERWLLGDGVVHATGVAGCGSACSDDVLFAAVGVTKPVFHCLRTGSRTRGDVLLARSRT